MRVRPISPSLVVTELSDRIAGSGRGSWLRVAIDGAPPAAPWDLADALVSPLRALGRDVVRVSARDFLRPASLRFEFGRDDPDVDVARFFAQANHRLMDPVEAGGEIFTA